MMRDPRPSPPQTRYEGERVCLASSLGDYDGANFLNKGIQGTVLGYATPELKRRQVWTEESYFVRLDGDPPDSRGRVLSRRDLIPLGPA
jgi:hypothetical protein